MAAVDEVGAELLIAEGWWALYTRHQHEKVVAEMLSVKGFDVFLPLYESIRRWKDRRKGSPAAVSLVMFSCVEALIVDWMW